MNFGWFQSLLLGAITGLTEILPVSVQSHNRILIKFMGTGDVPSLLSFFTHIGVFFAIYVSCKSHILKMVRAQNMSRIPKKKRKRPLDIRSLMDLRLLITMVIPVILMLFVWRKVESISSNMIITATFLFLNGLILYIPQFLPSSNKDCRMLSRVEGLLMGLGGTAFAIPGLSGTGVALSIASIIGVDRKYGLSMILLMNLATLAGKAFYDLVDIISFGLGQFSMMIFLSYMLSAMVTFIAAFFAIKMLRRLAENRGFGSFAYYNWGLALFTFILSLMA